MNKNHYLQFTLEQLTQKLNSISKTDERFVLIEAAIKEKKNSFVNSEKKVE